MTQPTPPSPIRSLMGMLSRALLLAMALCLTPASAQNPPPAQPAQPGQTERPAQSGQNPRLAETSQQKNTRQESAQQQLAALTQRLHSQTPAVLRGQFEQRKHVQGFRQPLVSTGNFAIARQQGLAWHTEAPFASTLVITADKLQTITPAAHATTDAQAADVQTLDTTREPGLRAFTHLLLALLAGQFEQLQNQFELEDIATQDKTWSVTLRPGDATLARFISRIHIQGQDFVQAVTLHERNGDHSAIRFSGQQPGALTAQEAALLQ